MHRYILIGELLLIVLPITGLFIIFVPIAMSEMPGFTSFPSWKLIDIYAIIFIVFGPWALISLWVIGIKYIIKPTEYNVSRYWLLGLVVGILLSFMGVFTGNDPIGSLVIFGLPVLPAIHLLVLLKT